MGRLKQILCAAGISACLAACSVPADREEVFALLDLERPGLEQVKTCCDKQQWSGASAALLEYFRTRQDVFIPGQDATEASEKDFLWADDALRHTFHVLEEPVWNYGRNINWEYWPVKDIEMRVQLHRQGWWTSLAKAYCTSGKEKYAREYVREFRDWVQKNPYKPFGVDQRGTVSSGTIDVDSPNECFAWRPLEVGIRLLRWCRHFALFLDSPCFTPEFLMEFLQAYHQNAAVLMHSFSPSGNHLIHQSSGILRAGICFPEFKDAEAWVQAGVDNLNREISHQSYPDGCHFELDPGYHIGFVESYNDAIQVAVRNGRLGLFPSECLEQLVRMTNYYLDYRYPDGTHPCFSDARRHDDLADAELLKDVSGYCDSPAARQLLWFATEGKEGDAPAYKSSGHPDTGFYTFRDGWFDANIIMPVKATERGMWHAQPDFGTFELWAYGKVLMPDAGAYTYSGDEEIERQRAYFKQTARHNVLTLDDRDYDDPQPKVLAWNPDGDKQVLIVEHQAYEGLTHRRRIAFIEEKYFEVVDDVVGPACGRLSLRFGFGQGSLEQLSDHEFIYRDGDAGLRISISGPEGSVISIDKDWFSEAMHEKHERPVIRLDVPRSPGTGTQRFVTILRPFFEQINNQ
ncbi:MAG: alginate lyase family protein [Bacteroidales bacterium]|nr:alginate lyase family protein [Bacteroidales bacterium]